MNKTRPFLTIIIIVIILAQLTAQNLIRNGGFEDFTGSPSENDNLTSVVGWDYIDGFPEYYLTGHNNVINAVPWGGSGVVSLGLWLNSSSFPSSPDQIDAFGTRLTEPMVAGKHYVLSFYAKNGWWDDDYCANLEVLGISKIPNYIGTLSPNGLHFAPELIPGITTLYSTSLLTEDYHHFRICIIPEIDITYLIFKSNRHCDDLSVDDYIYLDEVSLFEEATFSLLGNDTTLCVDETIVLDASFENAIITWADGFPEPLRIVDEAGTYNVFVDAFDPVCPIMDSVQISYNPIIIPDKVLIEDTTICYETSIVLDAFAPGLFYEWENGSVSSSLEVAAPGNYRVILSNGSCEKEDSVFIAFFNCKECGFYIPNVFSPNLDGVNDELLAYPQCDDISDFDFKIFNRWGSLIFQSNDINIGWDGKWKGREADSGTYIYTLSFRASEYGKIKHRMTSGDVTLLRGR